MVPVHIVSCSSDGKDVTPTFLKLKSNIKSKQADKIIKCTEKRLLRENIRLETNRIKYWKDQVEENKLKFAADLTTDDNAAAILDVAETTINNRIEVTHAQTKRRHIGKLERLISKQKEKDVDLSGSQLQKWVVNLSKYSLNKYQQSVLAKGLNFAVTPDNLPIDDMIVSTELACTSLDPPTADALRAEAVHILASNKVPPSNITKDERKAIKDLAKEDSIMVIQADKGNCTVVLDKEEYIEKANEMLADTNTYRKLAKNPTNRVRSELMKILNRLKSEQKITQKDLEYLRPSTTPATPRFYCTPKIHKPGAPLRPIVDYCGSVTYTVARSLSDILNPLMGKTPHHLENSSDLKKKIQELEIEEDECIFFFLFKTTKIY